MHSPGTNCWVDDNDDHHDDEDTNEDEDDKRRHAYVSAMALCSVQNLPIPSPSKPQLYYYVNIESDDCDDYDDDDEELTLMRIAFVCSTSGSRIARMGLGFPSISSFQFLTFLLLYFCFFNIY